MSDSSDQSQSEAQQLEAQQSGQHEQSAATEKKLSPLERVKQRQAAMRQGLQKKAQGTSAVRDGAGSAGTDAPPPRTNTPRRAGGS